jgi:hypothetical protein
MPLSEDDRANIQFLMCSPDHVLKEWFANATPDDVDYASRIMALWREELKLKYLDMYEAEEKLENSKYPDAARLIAKIKGNLDKPMTM